MPVPDYDSAGILDPNYCIEVGGQATANPTDADNMVYLFISTNPWASGDLVGADFTINILDIDPSQVFYISRSRKVGKFPLGPISDGQGAPYNAWSVHGFGDNDGSFSVVLGPRSGPIHFDPNATILADGSSLKGKLPVAETYFDDGQMCNMIWDNSALLSYNETRIGIAGYGPAPGGDGGIVIYPVPFPAGSSLLDQKRFEPLKGHVMRLVLYRGLNSAT